MSNEMTKKMLVEYLAESSDISVSVASHQLNQVLVAIEHGLLEHGKVALTGFGSFEIRDRPARTGRNPRTGDPMDIAASKSVGFKAGKKLKEAIAK